MFVWVWDHQTYWLWVRRLLFQWIGKWTVNQCISRLWNSASRSASVFPPVERRRSNLDGLTWRMPKDFCMGNPICTIFRSTFKHWNMQGIPRWEGIRSRSTGTCALDLYISVVPPSRWQKLRGLAVHWSVAQWAQHTHQEPLGTLAIHGLLAQEKQHHPSGKKRCKKGQFVAPVSIEIKWINYSFLPCSFLKLKVSLFETKTISTVNYPPYLKCVCGLWNLSYFLPHIH